MNRGGKRIGAGRKKKNWVKLSTTVSKESREILSIKSKEGEQINTLIDSLIKKSK